jgi:hypothetical protein
MLRMYSVCRAAESITRLHAAISLSIVLVLVAASWTLPRFAMSTERDMDVIQGADSNNWNPTRRLQDCRHLRKGELKQDSKQTTVKAGACS